MKNIHGGAFRETVDDLLGTDRGEQINTLDRSKMSEILSHVWRVFPLVDCLWEECKQVCVSVYLLLMSFFGAVFKFSYSKSKV